MVGQQRPHDLGEGRERRDRLHRGKEINLVSAVGEHRYPDFPASLSAPGHHRVPEGLVDLCGALAGPHRPVLLARVVELARHLSPPILRRFVKDRWFANPGHSGRFSGP